MKSENLFYRNFSANIILHHFFCIFAHIYKILY